MSLRRLRLPFALAACVLLTGFSGLPALSSAPAAAQQQPGIDEMRAPRGPFAPGIPTPESVLGHYPGADFQLADWPTILEYLRALDAASDRIVIEDIGTSTEGQPLVVALISSPENLAQRERYREISERLARGHGVAADEARALAAEGKAIVWIDSGLHASEVAHGQHAPEFAYVMVAGESSEMARMRDDVILVLMPNMNPDGLNIVANWYRSNLGTPYETSGLPVLYQKYVGHDNNRDWYMITQAETRAVARQLYEVWYPQIVYNHHQSAPFPARIFVPPFDDPANPNIPPLVLRGIERVGNAITTRLESEKKSGAVQRLGFTAWWNGGMRTAPYFHNMVGILTETALFRYATPNFYPPNDLPDSFGDGTSTRLPSMKYPMPWPGGWWRLRDPVEYMVTASLATVDVASRYREEWLLNSYRMASDAIARGAEGSPAAWVIPPEQPDDSSATELVNVLQRGGLEVYRSDEAFEADGKAYEAGTWVVPAAQAYRAYALDLLESQEYPDRRLYPGGPPDPPYDMAGWTLPYQMGVDVERVEAPFSASMERLGGEVRPEGRVEGSGDVFILDPRSNATAAAVNRLLAAGATVFWSDGPVDVGGTTVPTGAVVVSSRSGLAASVAQIAAEEGVVARATDRHPQGDGWQLHRTRLALYDPWTANMDAGWTRWVLEKYGFEYSVLRDAEIRKGKLEDRYDAVILPSASARSLVNGNSADAMPAGYAGGMTETGVIALQRFVEAGGTLIALDASGELAIERLNAPVADALAGVGRDEFFCPGSLLRIEVDNTNPVAFGMPEHATAFFVNSSAFDLPEDLESSGVQAVAQYLDGDLLESGWILGEEHIRGRAAVVEVARGAGRIIMLGFRVQFRAQPHETFKLLFNSIFYAGSERARMR